MVPGRRWVGGLASTLLRGGSIGVLATPGAGDRGIVADPGAGVRPESRSLATSILELRKRPRRRNSMRHSTLRRRSHRRPRHRTAQARRPRLGQHNRGLQG